MAEEAKMQSRLTVELDSGLLKRASACTSSPSPSGRGLG